MLNREQSRIEIERLVSKYLSLGATASNLTEEETKKDFILPLFRALNWNTEDSREVSAEEKISKGRVDYGFRIDGIPKLYVEAKAIGIPLTEKFAEQSVNYSWLKSTTWAVLSNFVQLDVYNAEWKSRDVFQKRFFTLRFDELASDFDRLWLLSRDSFASDELDRKAEEWGKKQKRIPVTPVTDQLFSDLIDWRQRLTKDIVANKSNARVVKTDEELDECVQRILDRMIFIRVCEDRELEPNSLQSRLREWKGSRTKSFYKLLVDVFHEYDTNYNSKLFSHHTADELEIGDVLFSRMVGELYQNREGFGYDFAAIDVDVLGSIYEQYLGYILKKHKKKASVVESYAQRKKMGIYYTPPDIVNFIVESTLGEALANSSSGKDLRVLDPACGSGSFLLAALDKLVAHKNALSFDQKIGVLRSCIFGADLDPKAVEIAQFNLLLDILERRKVLPVMDKNVVVGNSLVDDSKLDEHALTWNQAFPSIISEGGFDVVVGNPPYINAIELSKTVGEGVKEYWRKRFESARGTFDIYILFFEQALNLCREGGYVSFITPNKYLSSPYGTSLRDYIMANHTLVKVVDLSRIKVFEDPSVYPVITIIKKGKPTAPYTIVTERVLSEDVRERVQYKISSKTLQMMPEHNWGIILSDNAKLLQRIFEEGIPLEQVATVQATSTAAEADEYSDYISEKKGVPIINTGTIDRYSTTYGVTQYTRKGEKMLEPRLDISKVSENRRRLYGTSKVIFAKLALRPEAFPDLKGDYASINTNCVYSPQPGYDLETLTAILNSKLMAFVYSELFAGLKMGGGYFQFQAPQLRILPIKKPSEQQAEKIRILVEKMIRLNGGLNSISTSSDKGARIEEDIRKTDAEIDQAINELYGLTEDEARKVAETVKEN